MNDAPIITRGGFLRGILAAGVAPAIIPVAEAHSVAGLRRGLALRQAMAGGEARPYDREVEWLFANASAKLGPQINIPVNSRCTFECKMQATETQDRKYFGLIYGSGGSYNGCYLVATISGNYRDGVQWMGEFSSTKPSIDTTKAIVYKSPSPNRKSWIIDGVEFPVKQCNWNNAGTFYLFHIGSATWDVGPCKMWWCKIYENEILTHDMIPVVKDNVGYMFDKVTQELYGSSTEKSFEFSA